MKYIKTIAVAAGLACAAASSQAGIQLNFASITGSDINFSGGGNFDFENGGVSSSSVNQFIITSQSGSPIPIGDSTGDFGTITGAFHIAGPPSGSATSAAVTGNGTLTIKDATGTLTGTVNWQTIQENTSAGSLNLNASINLNSLVYTGTKSDLTFLAGGGQGVETVTFSFTTTESLLALYNGSVASSFANPAFSGALTSSFSPVPEPTTVIAGALLLLPFGLSTLRIIRKK
jgi:hypothetical protein